MHWGRAASSACLAPSTKTIVQPDFDDLRPAGVTNHCSRIIIDDASLCRASLRAGFPRAPGFPPAQRQRPKKYRQIKKAEQHEGRGWPDVGEQ